MQDLYKQVYEKIEQKETFIEDYITSVHQKLSSLGSNETSSSSTTQLSIEDQMLRTFSIKETPGGVTFWGVALSKKKPTKLLQPI